MDPVKVLKLSKDCPSPRYLRRFFMIGFEFHKKRRWQEEEAEGDTTNMGSESYREFISGS